MILLIVVVIAVVVAVVDVAVVVVVIVVEVTIVLDVNCVVYDNSLSLHEVVCELFNTWTLCIYLYSFPVIPSAFVFVADTARG